MAAELPPLTPRGQQIISLVLNAVAFGTHGDIGNVDSLAEKLGTTPGRLRPMLQKLVNQGYLTVEGDVVENVYPTVAALRWQDPKLTHGEAKVILSGLGKKSRR
jgi:DNA-binding IclR family transcriptional regulator